MTGAVRRIGLATALVVVFASGASAAGAEPATPPRGEASASTTNATSADRTVAPARTTAPAAPAALPLDVAADTECPAADAIGRALREILGLSASERLKEVARLAHVGAALVVTLRDADGRVLGDRSLPLEGTCDELTRAAAVVLATWLSDAHPEFVPRMAERANATPPAANDTDSAANGAKPAPRATPPTGSVRASGSVRPESEWRLRAGAALGASVLPAAPAFSGTLSVALVPERGGVGGTLRASALTSRERSVPGGKVRYFRWPLAAGATVRLVTTSVALELDGGGALGWLHVAGRAFSPNRSADDATFGTFAAARVLAAHGLVQPFAEVTGLIWLRSSRVYADATQPSVALPQAEMTVSAGASFVP